MEKLIKELNRNAKVYEIEADTDEKKEQVKGYRQAIADLTLLAKHINIWQKKQR